MPICRRTGSHSDVNPAHEFSGLRLLFLHELLDILFAVTAFRTRAGRFRDILPGLRALLHRFHYVALSHFFAFTH